eukprot:5467613-Amphidinium_carterae.1
MTSATAVVRAGTSLRKRTGAPLDDGHRTLNHFAGYEPNKTEQIPVHTPRTRKKIMGEQEDEQAYKLNETMDEFLGTVNSCLSQLALAHGREPEVAYRAGQNGSTVHIGPAGERDAPQQACVAQHALKVIRNEAHLFRDKMLVDAKTLCQYHVDKMGEMNNHYQVELQAERSRFHSSNQQFREKLETEALEYQHEVNKSTEQQVQAKLNQEVAKIQAEMTKVVNEATASRSQLKAQFEQEMGKVRAAGEQEHAARTQAEQALVSI